jgi:hypothetical protein
MIRFLPARTLVGEGWGVSLLSYFLPSHYKGLAKWAARDGCQTQGSSPAVSLTLLTLVQNGIGDFVHNLETASFLHWWRSTVLPPDAASFKLELELKNSRDQCAQPAVLTDKQARINGMLKARFGDSPVQWSDETGSYEVPEERELRCTLTPADEANAKLISEENDALTALTVYHNKVYEPYWTAKKREALTAWGFLKEGQSLEEYEGEKDSGMREKAVIVLHSSNPLFDPHGSSKLPLQLTLMILLKAVSVRKELNVVIKVGAGKAERARFARILSTKEDGFGSLLKDLEVVERGPVKSESGDRTPDPPVVGEAKRVNLWWDLPHIDDDDTFRSFAYPAADMYVDGDDGTTTAFSLGAFDATASLPFFGFGTSTHSTHIEWLVNNLDARRSEENTDFHKVKELAKSSPAGRSPLHKLFLYLDFVRNFVSSVGFVGLKTMRNEFLAWLTENFGKQWFEVVDSSVAELTPAEQSLRKLSEEWKLLTTTMWLHHNAFDVIATRGELMQI